MNSYGFCNLHLSNRFIYSAVFGQKNPTDLPKDICKFDYFGNPIIRYNTEYPILTLAVDDTDNNICMAVYKDGEIVLGRAIIQ